MAAFTACLIAAGAGLSLFARVQGFIVVLAAFILAVAAATLLSPALGTAHGLPVTLLVALVALQIGYGVGVVLRALLARLGHGSVERSGASYAEEPEAVAQRVPRPQNGGPLNHP